MKKVLYLTVKKCWFDLLEAGDKKLEFRRPSDWIKSRLEGNPYDVVCFRDGYGKGARTLYTDYRGYYIASEGFSASYTNGPTVEVSAGDYVILLGDIVLL
jgi:signal peptidase I